MKQGVPRGGVLSLFLFNLYMRSLPSPPEDVKIITYADITITSSGPDVKVGSEDHRMPEEGQRVAEKQEVSALSREVNSHHLHNLVKRNLF